MYVCCLCLAEADTDRKSDIERKLSAEHDSTRRSQPVSTDSSSGSFYTATPTNSTAATDSTASSFVGIFDDFDWDLDSAESLQCLSEEDLKKRHSVMIEKVICCATGSLMFYGLTFKM